MTKIEEIIKNRFENEKSPPIGTFKDRPIKDCMVIYAKLCMQQLIELIQLYGDLNFPTDDNAIEILNSNELINKVFECQDNE